MVLIKDNELWREVKLKPSSSAGGPVNEFGGLKDVNSIVIGPRIPLLNREIKTDIHTKTYMQMCTAPHGNTSNVQSCWVKKQNVGSNHAVENHWASEEWSPDTHATMWMSREHALRERSQWQRRQIVGFQFHKMSRRETTERQKAGGGCVELRHGGVWSLF